MTARRTSRPTPSGVVDETQVVRVPAGTTRSRRPQLRGGFRYLMLYLTGRGAVRLSDLQPALHGRPAAEGPARLPGRVPVLRRRAQPALVRRRLHGADVDDRPGDRPPLPRRAGARVQRREGRRRPERDRRRAQARPLRLGRRPRRRQPGRLPHDGRHAEPAGLLRVARAEAERGGPARRRLPAAPGRRGLELQLGRVRRVVDGQLRDALPLHRRSRVPGPLVRPAAGRRLAGSSRTSARTACVDVPGDAGGHWGYGNSGKESYDNALYVYALAYAARAAEAENRADLASAWRAQATRTAKAINDTLWDGTAYVVGPDDARHAQDGNAMALLAGVATGDRADAVRRFLAGLDGPFGPLTVDAPGGAVPQYVSPFVTSFQLETADTDTASACCAGPGRRCCAATRPGRSWRTSRPRAARNSARTRATATAGRPPRRRT